MNRALTLCSIAALALTGCGSDGDEVTLDDAWARTSATGQTTGAIYFDLTVAADDTLLRASVPAEIAGRAEIHEVVPADGSMGGAEESGAMDEIEGDLGDDAGDMAGSDDMEAPMDGMDGGHDGMGEAMVMRELTAGLALAADETVAFEPGGYHVMLLDLAEPLTAGDEIELTLEFATAGTTTVTVEAAESAP